MSTETPKKKFVAELLSLKRLWPYLRVNRRSFWLAVALIPVISALDMAIPIILKHTIDAGIIPKDQQALALGAALFLAAVVAEYLARAGHTLLMALCTHRLTRDMRYALIQHIFALSPRFHDSAMSGAIVTRATSDFDNLTESLNQGILSSVVDIAVLVGAIVGLLFLDWQMALQALIVVPIVAYMVRWFSRGMRTSMLEARAKLAHLNAFSQECLYGASTVKLLTAEPSVGQRYQHMTVAYRNAQMKSVVLDAVLFAVLEGIASITIGIVLWLALRSTTNASGLSAGLMVAFVQYVQNLFEPLKQLGNKIAILQGVFTSLERIFDLFETQDKVHGTQQPPAVLQGKLVFDNVTFAYGRNAQAQPVLHNISFRINEGESLAIVGATGSGKSTVVKLVAKLYDGYSGHIWLDDHDLASMDPRLLREKIAIVPQDITLFEGSIRFNISLDAPGISQADVERAAIAVGADHFIRELPGDYDFPVKEGGSNLSHGQRQLIAFARALAKDPKIMILDEATSSVDPTQEKMIQDAISRLLKGRTVIVIAHRLSTIEKCSSIMVLAHGHIQEIGTHEALLEKEEGAYRRLVYAHLMAQSAASGEGEDLPGTLTEGEVSIPLTT